MSSLTFIIHYFHIYFQTILLSFTEAKRIAHIKLNTVMAIDKRTYMLIYGISICMWSRIMVMII